jgi:hypothetical protein
MSTTDNLDDQNPLAKFEMELVAGLKPEPEDVELVPQADASPAPSEQATPTPSASPAPDPVASTPVATPATPAAPTQEANQGDPRAALRASRAAERRARQEAETLRRELAELRAKAPAPPADPDMARLEAELPEAARLLKKIAEKVETTAAPAAATPAEPEFEPDVLPPELQVVVDKNDQLSDWQHDPDQTAWSLAKSTDGMLSKHPAWKDKPMDERLAEVARRVRVELGTPSTPAPSPAAAAAAIIDRTGTRPIETLSDLNGGAAPSSTTEPDFSKLSVEDITAALDKLGRG